MLVLKFIVLPALVYWTLYIFMRAVVGVDPAWSALVALAPTLASIAAGYLTEVRRRDRVGE